MKGIPLENGTVLCYTVCDLKKYEIEVTLLMSKILRRIFTVLPAVLLQLLWLYLLFSWLSPWAGLIEFFLSILSFLFVLYLITKREESTYKILWLLIILTFPIPGTLLYLIFGNKRTAKPLKKKLDAVGDLTAIPEKTPRLYEALSAENVRLSQTFRWIQNKTGFPLRENRNAQYYPLGDDMYPVMLAEIEKAQRFIFVEYFIIDNGLMWDSIVEILERKAAQGVDVRVLYDDLGSISTYNKDSAKALIEKGIRCRAFNPLVFIKGTLNYRDHRKMLIIDGKTAFSGGINLADEYINHIEKHGHWKDIGFKITGEAVQDFTEMFRKFWDAFTGDRIPDKLLKLPSLPEEVKDRDGYVLSYYDSPFRNDAVSNELFIDLLSQAQNYAWFFTPYLMPGDALLDAFVRAAGRGVDVRLLLPGIPDKKLVFRMTRSFYTVLLEAGVKIYEYTPGFVHAKGSIIDDCIGTVGTVNLDYRSLFLHFENNSLFYKASLLKDLKEDFIATQQKCQERTLDNVGRSFGKWLLDGILRIFTPLC